MKQVCTFGTVAGDGEKITGIAGSFGEFDDLLYKNGFTRKRVLICYREVSGKEVDRLMEQKGTAWCEEVSDP